MSESKKMSPSAETRSTKGGSGGRLFMIGLTVFEIGASILIVNLVTSNGGSDFAAYMWSLVPPVVGAGIYWARIHDFSRMSMAVLAFNLLSAGVAAVGSHDPRVLLYKDCFVTGIIGLIFLASLFFSRPLVFWFGQRFATDGSPDQLAWWNSLWQYKAFRDSQRQTTILWAVVMFVEAGTKAWVIAHSSFQTGYAWTQILPLIATAVGIGGSMWFGVRAQRAGQRARQQRLSTEQADDTGSPHTQQS